jgi:hypothetical protein
MDKIVGLELLKKIIDKEIVHQDYNRVTDLADKYFKMKTGNGIETMLQKIETRVSDEEFEQIKRIYRSIIPATLNSTELPFTKALRKKPKVRIIDFGEDSDNKKTELEGYISKYWGDKSLEKYLEFAFVAYNFIDPNAFLITEFDPFDPKKEKASPYPFVADSHQAIMFEYKNEILKYLVVKLPTTYIADGVEKPGEKYTMYLGMETIVLNQQADGTQILGSDGVVEIKSKYFGIYYYEPKNEKVPAIRFGYKRDEETQGRTFVSVFHCVIGLLEKTLKIDSELDLSTAMVAFPQRYRYEAPCDNPGCNKGHFPDGRECDVCHGTGTQPVHKGTQDVISLALPRNKDQMINLQEMAYDHSPDIDLLKFDSEYLEKLEKKVQAKMFNADLYTRSEVSTTATEKILETDNLNDTLHPFGEHYSSVWEFVVKDIATFTDLSNDLTVQHKLPEDLKFKTLSELMTELKTAKDAGASTSTIAAIEDDINEILYFDRPDALKQIRIKNAINPFRGYSEANIRFIISQGNTTVFNRTLWENLEAIFQELELEVTDLYDLEPKMLKQKVTDKTNEFITKIDGEKKKEAELYETPGTAFNGQQ